jgi:TolA-binding protein
MVESLPYAYSPYGNGIENLIADPYFSLAAASAGSGKVEDAESVYRLMIENFPGTRFQKTAQARLSEISKKK